MNNLLLTDTYKACAHHRMFPPKTEVVYSYLESRGGEFERILFFGLHYLLSRYFYRPFFAPEDIADAESLLAKHCPDGSFNGAQWEELYKAHGGYLPVAINCLPEGTVTRPHVPLLTIYNTDARFPWLVNRLESLLLHVWYPITVASQSFEMLEFLKRYTTPEHANRMLIDFSYRGASSDESAALAGAAHLVAGHTSTDNLPGLALLRELYAAGVEGFSAPASEHSVTTAWNSDSDVEFFKHCLREFPTGIISLVMDTYDLYRAVRSFGEDAELRELVTKRDGLVVLRPDSGDPLTQIPEIMHLLEPNFPSGWDDHSRLVIHPKFKILWGDGIKRLSLYEIVEKLSREYAIENFLFGSGGGLAQDVNRDTCKIAFKSSAIRINGQWKGIRKNPVTDPGKASRPGMFRVDADPAQGWSVCQRYLAEPAGELDYMPFELGPYCGSHKRPTIQDIRQRIQATKDIP